MSKEIESFIETMKSLKVSIEELKSPSGYNNTNHKITLILSLLDLMAKCGSYKLSNRDRFIDFIDKFCNWDSGWRVSLPQLSIYLSHDSSSRLTNLRQYVDTTLATWPIDRPILIESEPILDEIKSLSLWPLDYKGPNKTRLNHFTHINLLWNQRNSLVHEMRTSGYGWAIFEKDKPYYTSCGHTERNLTTNELEITKRTFELYYPFNFYINLVDNAINNLSIYLKENDINPYDSYRFGSLWLDIND